MDGGIRLGINSVTMKPKGFGYIDYKNPESALAAVKKASAAGISLKGRMLYVDYEEGNIKGGFKSEKKVHR